MGLSYLADEGRILAHGDVTVRVGSQAQQEFLGL